MEVNSSNFLLVNDWIKLFDLRVFKIVLKVRQE